MIPFLLQTVPHYFTMTTLQLDDFQRLLLLDTLKDIINTGEIDCDLKDYLELDNNPYETLYEELLLAPTN